MKSSINHLITHSGWFHADDACAAAILMRLYPTADLVRTRDMARIDHLGATGIVFDVGWRHDPEARRFDHHQPGAPQRPDGTRYSAVGLVWQHYGRDWIRSIGIEDESIEAVWAKLDQEMILPIDLVDNGQLAPADIGVTQRLSLVSLIDGMNPNFDEDPEISGARFLEATGLMANAMESRARGLAAGLRAERLVGEIIQAQWGDPILVLPVKMPFQSAVRQAGADHVTFIIAPSLSGGCGIEGMALAEGSYSLRRDLPEAWAGLSDRDLEEACGVAGARFCHRGRFYAVADTAEAAVAMARLALIEDLSPSP